MNQPSPAIVAKQAVKRLPRAALWLFCLAYVLAGFLGRDPWKTADANAFGAMQELALGLGDWRNPQALLPAGGPDSLLPLWLGAGAMQMLPFFDAGMASRLPFIAMLGLTLAGTWYAVYHLARSPLAQPVAFAFGGEADPRDYARALADAGLLALLACLGLAQLSHETTPALAQLGFTSLLLYGLAAAPYRHTAGQAGLVALAMVGLTLSGAPTVAVLMGLGGGAIQWWSRRQAQSVQVAKVWPWLIVLISGGCALLALWLDLWHWRVDTNPWAQGGTQKNLVLTLRLFVWFMWPAWPLAIWTLWQWRRQLSSHHVALPLWFFMVAVGSTLLTTGADRSLLLALPALAALSAFALPTLKRGVAALIDWFTLIFFTVCALTIWVIWIALQTGFPQKPAANVARLAPGFEPSFSWLAFLVALVATAAWAWLVRWRTGRHRSALWKSLVLPAGGTALCWLLLMSLWLPLLDHARGYQPLARQVLRQIDPRACVEALGLSTAQAATLRYHAKLDLKQAQREPQCPALLVDRQAQELSRKVLDLGQWTLVAAARRPTEKSDDLLIYRRTPRPAPGNSVRE